MGVHTTARMFARHLACQAIFLIEIELKTHAHTFSSSVGIPLVSGCVCLRSHFQLRNFPRHCPTGYYYCTAVALRIQNEL